MSARLTDLALIRRAALQTRNTIVPSVVADADRADHVRPPRDRLRHPVDRSRTALRGAFAFLIQQVSFTCARARRFFHAQNVALEARDVNILQIVPPTDTARIEIE
jgi:hypothetical protein